MIDQKKEVHAVTHFDGILMDWRDLEELTKVSRRTLDRLIQERKFPEPIRIGKLCRWWAKDVLAYLGEDRVTARPGSEAESAFGSVNEME